MGIYPYVPHLRTLSDQCCVDLELLQLLLRQSVIVGLMSKSNSLSMAICNHLSIEMSPLTKDLRDYRMKGWILLTDPWVANSVTVVLPQLENKFTTFGLDDNLSITKASLR